MPAWKDDNGEGPVKAADAKARVKQWWNDPKHEVEKGSKADAATRDDRLDDPAKQEPE